MSISTSHPLIVLWDQIFHHPSPSVLTSPNGCDIFVDRMWGKYLKLSQFGQDHTGINIASISISTNSLIIHEILYFQSLVHKIIDLGEVNRPPPIPLPLLTLSVCCYNTEMLNQKHQ